MTKLSEKREYLAGKLVDGARALNEFFDVLSTNREASPRDLASDLSSKYSLTSNQKEYLEKVTERAERAQGIVRYLEDRFGIDENGAFQDVEGLHSLLLKGRYVPKKLAAQSCNIGIGFEKNRWTHRNSAGFVKGATGFNQLGVPLEKTLSRLEERKPTNVLEVAFYLPSKDCIQKKLETGKWKIAGLSEVDKTLCKIFGLPTPAENVFRRIKDHELRHVFDRVVGDQSFVYNETPTHLYEGVTMNSGIRRDKKAIEDRLKEIYSRIEHAREIGMPEFVVMSQSTKRSINDKKRMLSNISEVEAICKDAQNLTLEDRRVLSYFFSTTPWEKVPDRLRAMLDALKKR
jgi:hypothetical protein